MTRRLPFSFLHCADLHLDSPFEGVHAVDPEIAVQLRDATFNAFDRVIEQAIGRRVDFVLISGDVYDGADRSLRAQLKFRESLARAARAGIRCFVAHGNHDPLDGWDAGLAMPDGVHRFGGRDVERIAVERDGTPVADVYGISFPQREVRENLAVRFDRTGNAPFSIGVLHCNLGGDRAHDNYAPCTEADLAAAEIDYWALGHIHQRRVVRATGPCIVYPGNTQGRNVRETGPRGCYAVKVSEYGDITREFIETDSVRWFDQQVDIAGLETLDALLTRLGQVCETAHADAGGRGVVLRLRLVGRGDLHPTLHRGEVDLVSALREREPHRADFIWVESVQVKTQPAVDIASRRLIEDFVGDFLRAAETLRSDDTGMSGVRDVLRGRPESAAIARQLQALTDSELQNVILEAETMGLDYLLGDEG